MIHETWLDTLDFDLRVSNFDTKQETRQVPPSVQMVIQALIWCKLG